MGNDCLKTNLKKSRNDQVEVKPLWFPYVPLDAKVSLPARYTGFNQLTTKYH